MLFGLHLGLANSSPGELTQLWELAEELGFDWLSVFDHFYSSNGTSQRHSYEAVAMHALLAARTKRVRVGCLVYVAAFRHPALLAKSLMTIDHISGGRCTAGVGTGWNRREFAAFGFEYLPVTERYQRLEDYVSVLRTLLVDGDDPAQFRSPHYRLDDAVCLPPPVQDRLPIWLGGVGERYTLPTIARLGDGWNAPFLTPAEFHSKRQILSDLCEEQDRAIDDITCTINVGYAADETALRAQFGRRSDGVRRAVLTGPASRIAAAVSEYQEAGVDQLNIAMRGVPSADSRGYNPNDIVSLADALSVSASVCAKSVSRLA